MGVETEYGVLEPGRPGANPILLSSHVVGVHAAARGRRPGARWDYDTEDPFVDARGFRLQRAGAHPSLLTDDPSHPAPSGDDGAPEHLARPAVDEYEDPGAVNVILTNGARLYVDHAHPEYSSPEVTSPLDAVLWDRAGELVMLASVRALAATPGLPDVVLYKNNVDGKGASYGTHENYLVDRQVPFDELARRLMPFLATRPVLVGAGRVGLGPRGERPGFQLSARADYVEAEIGLETTLRRPIVNTRDEPHADPRRFRRLHVIVGDANLLEVSTYLKVGTLAAVLWLLEQAEVSAAAARAAARLDRLVLRAPVAAVHQVSHDVGLTARLELADGRRMTALEVQAAYLDAVREGLEATAPDAQTLDVLGRWESLIGRLATDPASCAREVEWLAKLRVLEGMRRRERIGWEHPRLAAVDLQWSDIRPERGIYHRVAAAGAVDRLVDPDAVATAVRRPPEDTRAYFRGEVVARYPGEVRAASWDSVVFDLPGSPTLARVALRDPRLGTRASVGALLADDPDAATLLTRLAR